MAIAAWFATPFGAADAGAQQPQLTVATIIGDAVQKPESPQYEAITAAIDKFKARDVEAARTLLTEARKAHPELPPVEVLMAKLYAVANQPQLVRAELELAARREPKDPEAYLLFGELSLLDRRVTDAEALYEKAAALVPAFEGNAFRTQSFQKRLLQGQATVAENRLQWEAAEKLLRSLLLLEPKNAGIQQRLGRAIFQQAEMDDQQKYKESYAAFTAALALDEKAIKPDVAMGQLFEQAAQDHQKDPKKFKYYRDKAAEFFNRVTLSKDLNSHLAAATWAMQTNQIKLAQTYADAALKIDPTSVDAKLTRALAARFTNDLSTAERYLSEAFTQSPGSFAVTNQLALVLADSNDPKKRERALELALINARQYQQNPEAVSTLGWVYFRLGRENEAEKTLNTLINANALSSDSAYYVARIFNQKEKYADAKRVLQLALNNPQPFANRMNATELLSELDKKLPAATDDPKQGQATKAGAKESKSKSSK